MERRNFLIAGAALGGVAVPVAAQAVTASSAGNSGPSVFDFGAVGNGTTDDSAAFSKALQFAAANSRIVRVPSGTYAIARPINFLSTANTPNPWGLQCEGAVLQSKITTGETVMTLTSQHTVRYFRLSGGMKIRGSGTDGNGLRIFAPSGKHFYNFSIEGLSVEGVGKDGLLVEGNVFEASIYNSYFQDCKQNGATFAHSKGGVCSAIAVFGCYFNQNGKYGLCATHFDSQYGGATDVRVYGGYCRENKSYGFYYNNGTAGAALEQVGFENNCKALKPGDQNGAHIYGMSSMQLRSCTGYNQFGGATYLLRGFFTGLTTLEGCRQSAGGAMAATNLSRLVQVNGSDKGHVLMRGCDGGVAVVSNTKCTWRAENCSGPAPSGLLNIRGVVGV